ncbi:hypothetical protein J3F83DRAFT_734818 [Trichoderma novae-zelandiae]
MAWCQIHFPSLRHIHAIPYHSLYIGVILRILLLFPAIFLLFLQADVGSMMFWVIIGRARTWHDTRDICFFLFFSSIFCIYHRYRS